MIDLPVDHARPAIAVHRGTIEARILPADLVKALGELSRGEGVTLFMTLLAGFQALLSRYTGQEDIVTGSPIAGRTHAEVERLIGFFVNTLALRTDLSGNPSFRELLGRVRETALGAYAHADVPFERLVEELQPERSLSYTPIFQVLFALQNAPQQMLQLPGLELERVPLHQGTAAFDMSWFAVHAGEELVLRVEYDTDLFERETVARMLGHYERLLREAVEAPETRVAGFALLGEAERQQVLHDWNRAAEVEYPECAAHQLFEAQVERTPNAFAVEKTGDRKQEDKSQETGDRRKEVTYAELNCMANRVAH